MTVYTTIDSPVGELMLVGEESATAATGVALTSLSMPEQRNAARPQPHWRHDPRALAPAAAQILAYFAGELRDFDMEFATRGTPFQERVWQALDAIPYGTTTTYGRLAERIGVSRAEVRALGTAVGANPLLLVRPCHRVIGADGTLRGYAAGIERKQRLLVHEGALQPLLG